MQIKDPIPPPRPGQCCSVIQQQKISSWTAAYFVFWERQGEVFVIASALKSFILKLDLAVSTFPGLKVLAKKKFRHPVEYPVNANMLVFPVIA